MIAASDRRVSRRFQWRCFPVGNDRFSARQQPGTKGGMSEIRACFVGAFDSVASRHGAKPQPIDLRKDVPHPMRALAPVLYLRQGTFVIVLLR